MRHSNADLAAEVVALGDLSREELAALWERAHGHSPPKGIRNELLVRSAAWHLQAKRLGGLSPNTKRLLKAAMAEAEAALLSKRKSVEPVVAIGSDALADREVGSEFTRGPDAVRPSPKRRRTTLLPGARLIRDWNGKTHIVDVIEEGFVFQAKVHKSLTAIAHQITGAHWSGPRFFGL